MLLNAQVVRVYNVSTQKPILDIAVFSETTKKKINSNTQGELILDLSIPEEKYTFFASDYKTITFCSREILARKNKIYLAVNTESLNEVVISNTKWEQTKRQISRKIVSIKKEDIFILNPQTTADAIAKTGNVFVQKSQQGGGSPIIRGFSTNRLLISVDGIRMNTAIFRSGNLQNIISIDPLFIESTEVILGPGSVVYGSDAIGGTLNFKTLNPKIRSKNKNKRVSGNAFYRFSSANSENTLHADVNLGFQKWASLSSFSYNSFDDLIQGSNGPDDFLRTEFVERINGVDQVIQNENPKRQVRSGYTQYNLLQKFIYNPNEDWELGLQFIHTITSDFDRYDRLQRRDRNTGQFRNAEWFYGPQEWLMGLQTISYKKNNFFTDKLKISSAYQFFKESRNTRDFNSIILNTNTEKLDVLTFNIDAEKNIWEKAKLNYGTGYVDNKVNSAAVATNINTLETSSSIATRYPDGSTWQSFGAYAVLNLQVSEPLNISGGLRYNQVKLRSRFDNPELDFPFSTATLDTDALTWNLGGTYVFDSGFSLKGNVNTAFRAPNIDDIGKIFNDSKPGILFVPNPNLKSEYAYNFSLGIDFEKNNYLVSLTGYYTFLDDALTEDFFNLNGQQAVLFRGEQSSVFATQNSNSARIYGVEFIGQLSLTQFLKIKGAYTLTRGEETRADGEKVNVRHVPPSFGNVHMLYKKEKWSVDFFTDFNGGFSFTDLAPSERLKSDIYARDENGNPFLSSWYTINIRGHYNLNTKISFTTALENITDQRYRTYSSGISAAGINFVSAIKYSF